MPCGLTLRQLQTNRQYIRNLYGNRCVRCGRAQAGVVHEIEPRSMRPKDWFAVENCVVLCSECHEHIHQHGSQNFADELRNAQARVLGYN